MTSFSVISDSCQAMLTLSPFPRSRVSAASFVGGANGRASTSISRIFAVNFVSWRSRRCPCLIYGSNVRSSSRRRAVLASCAAGAQEEVKNLRPFLRARNEEELLSIVRKEAESGRLSSNIADGLEELFFNYRNAVLQSGVPGANEIILSNMAVLFDRILLDEEVPFEFSSHHVAIREPFDYYMFSQNYIRPLIDFRNSYVGNISLFHEVNQKLQQGHNIILISNHQSEADPAVISLLLERTHPCIGEKMTYVAGDRVIVDPLCKPFSMGRNLLCVYSKKHMDDDPKLTESKKKANTRTLKELALLLRAGSQLIWIAPSGGRDRPDPHTGEWSPVRHHLMHLQLTI